MARRKAINNRYVVVTLVVLVGLAAVIYGMAAVKQKDQLNLSATAGGQYPYLAEARRMADEGCLAYMGDRNRMPLYPAALSLVAHPDWPTFVDRASWFAIITSGLMLVVIFGACMRFLDFGSAALVTVSCALLVFLTRVSFVQAELLYYTLLACIWLLGGRLLTGPSWKLGAACGCLLGLAYLVKASALPMVLCLAALLAAGGALGRVLKIGRSVQPAGVRRKWPAIAMLFVGFLVVTAPYLTDNIRRYGVPFYNVNSRFFMWCDSWREAKTFADRYDVSNAFPDAPPDTIPGPGRYWRSHSLAQIGERWSYGFTTLARLASHHPLTKYMIALLLAACCLGMGGAKSLRLFWRDYGWWAILMAGMLLIYLPAYAWYATIAYGDRFVLSLFLPALLLLTVCCVQIVRRFPGRKNRVVRSRIWTGITCLLVVVIIAETVAVRAPAAVSPTVEFVQFCFSESRERERAGDTGVARNGYEGVLQLDPTYFPAWMALGMLDLAQGKVEDAHMRLSRATAMNVFNPEAWNGLGSVCLQQQRVEESIRHFQRAISLDDSFAPAWFNMAVGFEQLGMAEELRAARDRIRELDPRLAEHLDKLLSD
ncbi:MAG: tetratricopeptide repeat protein [Planctomycetota bacterium]